MDIRQVKVGREYQIEPDTVLRFRPKLNIQPIKIPAGQIVLAKQKYAPQNAVFVQWGRVAGWVPANSLAPVAPAKGETPPEDM